MEARVLIHADEAEPLRRKTIFLDGVLLQGISQMTTDWPSHPNFMG
jgi:hypothetical protein